MNINPTIANYALLTIITKIGKKSFKNIAEKNGISDKTVYRMLRSGRESLKISDAIAQSLFSKAKELKVIIDDTTLRKTFANTMEGIEPHYDTKTGQAINSYKLIVSAITDGTFVIPNDAAFLMGKDFCNDPKKDSEVTVDFFIKEAQKKFPNAFLIAVLDGAFARLTYLKHAVDSAIATEVRMHCNRVVRYKEKMQKLSEIKELKPKGRQKARTILVEWHDIPLYITAVKYVNKDKSEKIVYQAATYCAIPRKHAEVYKARWGIEKLFRTTKQTLGLQECYSRKIGTQYKHICAVLLAYSILQLEMKANKYKKPESAARVLEKKKNPLLERGMPTLNQIFGVAHA